VAIVPLKLPNPVTDEAQIASVIEALIEFEGFFFNHKAMGSLLARKNLMGAQGRTGEQAIAASAQAPDASRESSTMMAKQYSQVLRCSGMILPVSIKGSRDTYYIISPLLKQIRAIENEHQRRVQFWRYWMRSYVNPSPHSKSQSEDNLRPFVTIMRMQLDLGGGCIPWEMLIGPQCQLNNDTDEKEYQKMIDSISKMRKKRTWKNLTDTVTQYQRDMIAGKFGGNYTVGKIGLESGDDKKIKDSMNTWQNWTRLSGACGINAGIWELEKASVLGYDFVEKSARMLTKDGRDFANRIISMRDVRRVEALSWPSELLHAFLRVVNGNLLKEWGVKIDEAQRKLDLNRIKEHDSTLSAALLKDEVLHAPYSQHDIKVLIEAKLLGDTSTLTIHPYSTEKPPELIKPPTIELIELKEFPKLLPFETKEFPWPGMTDSEVLKQYEESNATDFGTAVGLCFNCMGLEWKLGRTGDVTNRIDGTAFFSNGYITPVELKSPSEVPQLNLKSIRQAAENAMLAPKIASDMEGDFTYSPATASLTIGWDFPPERSDLDTLILRNREYWGIKILALKFSDLIKMARSSSQGHNVDFEKLLAEHGVYRWAEHE
jgi:hypothetical protein